MFGTLRDGKQAAVDLFPLPEVAPNEVHNLKNNQTKKVRKNDATIFEEAWSAIKRSFKIFLTVPTIVIFGFLMLAVLSNIVDHEKIGWLLPLTSIMKQKIFSDSKATGDLLGTISASLITVSSLTVTLLLLVVQQTAASMTTQVLDQFLRNRYNQLYFGFFVGLALFALLVLATVSGSFNPVFSATIALCLTVVALIFLIVLIYTTINQMRPAVIIEAIQKHILAARKNHFSLRRSTRRASSFEGGIILPVTLERHGYVTEIKSDHIAGAIHKIGGEAEVTYVISVGDYLSTNDVLAYVKGNTMDACEKISKAVYLATILELQRQGSSDPGDGIEQLEMIAWTSVSTAKSNPYPGLLTVRALRNIISIWHNDKNEDAGAIHPVVYNDNVNEKLFETLETLAIVSTESMQHQTFTEVVTTFSVLFERLQLKEQDFVENILLRLLSAMGDLVLSTPLEASLGKLVAVLKRNQREQTANAVEEATKKMKNSIGSLHSRSTRSG